MLKQVSGFFFYLLGASFFLAYLLMHNQVQVQWSAWWMQVADLPLVFSAVVYGATSFLLSVKKGKPHPALTGMVWVVCALFFIAVCVMNFWGVTL